MNSVKISPYVRIAKNNASYVSLKMRNLLLYFILLDQPILDRVTATE